MPFNDLIMKRLDISRLEKYRATYFKIGLVLSIALVTLAFNYTVPYPEIKPIEEAVEQEEAIEVVRTVQNKPKPLPPPPKITSIEEIIEETVEFIEEPLPEPVETVVEAPVPPTTGPKDMPKPKMTPPPPPVVPPAVEEPEIDEPFVVVEEMPRFPGCEQEGWTKKEKRACAEKTMMEFLYKHIRYPALAKETGIEGTVVATFIVEKDGSITKLDLMRDIGGGCGKETLRVLEKMPIWVPGKQRGKPVRVQYRIPVRYKLR